MVEHEVEPRSTSLAKIAIALMVFGAVWVAVSVPITRSQAWAQPGVFAFGAGVFLLFWWMAGGRR